jgi:hypothetical protein
MDHEHSDLDRNNIAMPFTESWQSGELDFAAERIPRAPHYGKVEYK